MSNKGKLATTAGLIVICTFISKFLGLLRDSITAAKYNTGDLDAFFQASNVPMVLFIMIGAAITTTLIPLYNEKLKEGKKEAVDFISNVLNVFIVVTVVISIVCIVFSKPIVTLLNPGFVGAKLDFTQKLTNILIPTLIFNAVIYIFNAVLQSEGNFTIPSLVALPLNAIVIGYLVFFGSNHGIVGLTIITFIATFAQIIPQVIAMKRVGFKYSFKIDFKDPMLIRMCIMLVPVILGTGVQQINTFIERAQATHFGEGSVTYLNYAYRVFALFVDIFVVTLSTIIYPRMAKQTAKNEISEMKKTLSESIGMLILTILPISFIVMAQSRPIVYILFQRGAFKEESTIQTALLLTFYAIGLLAFGMRDFVCKAYYTLKDTRTPMINSAIAMVVNIVLIFVFGKTIGLRGLALANATSMYIACGLLIYALTKKIGSINGGYIIKTAAKTIIASIPMVIIIRLLNTLLSLNYDSMVLVLVKVAISSLAGIVVFVIVSIIIGIEEVKGIRNFISKKINRKIG
ncbi:murein biosynthesis integral membrane protein MurJ [Clostridium sp. A1-XYC3]|uniref:Probable lipid II flippase MurJ n=1 Tax=Clostridium tanneri TaxID=3037988 RepID=A0ABU4JY28_9CLOT|nr:murein biosynthesis integral membrane protein MurJ [Clostridium sp. A1-XYC3]MDW8803077.1 murein biosynthesis integral membrane protein MurJ [Clostridium sp. A1-XYC3]